MDIRIINKSKNDLPTYGTSASAGVDLRANLTQDVVMKPMERTIIPTGLFMEIPVGFEAQVRPRSGLAIKKGVTVLNTPGTIDADYRGEIMIILINLSNEDFVVQHGERIAQMVIASHEQAQWKLVDDLTNTDRGTDGFGSTGV